jgi:hypothetical protein
MVLLKELRLRFTPGYSYNNTKDRYVNTVVIGYGQVNMGFEIPDEIANKLLDILKEELSNNADNITQTILDRLNI